MGVFIESLALLQQPEPEACPRQACMQASIGDTRSRQLGSIIIFIVLQFMQIFIYFPQKQHRDNLIQNILFSCFLFKPFIYNILGDTCLLAGCCCVYFACFRDFRTSPNEPRTTIATTAATTYFCYLLRHPPSLLFLYKADLSS